MLLCMPTAKYPVTVILDGDTRVKCLSTPRSRGENKNEQHPPLLRADNTVADPFVALPRFSPNPDGRGAIWLIVHGESLTLAYREFVKDVVFPSFEWTMSKVSKVMDRNPDLQEFGLFMFDGEYEALDVFIENKDKFGVNGLKHCAGCSMYIQPRIVQSRARV